jgi:hypothetical protein
MTQQNPVFDISEFELRDFTNPYLSPSQATEVASVEDRVNSQLNFLAQMLGWNGPNYWNNLPETVDQKRQLLGGSFGVYNSYVIPRIYEIRNWDNTILVDRIPLLRPGKQTKIVRILVGDDTYQLQSVQDLGDKYLISIGELSENFFTQIANGTQILVDIPPYRPAPFYRPSIGIAGDCEFLCKESNGELSLYPSYDTENKFPFRFPILFAGSVYYFNKPVYFASDSSLSPEVSPKYDANRDLWYFQVPSDISNPAGLTGFLAVAQSNATESANSKLEVVIRQWVDPSDWGSIDLLSNFRGTWGNKGGDLPFNFVFDALSVHGFDESQSVYLSDIEQSLSFNDIVNYIYYLKTTMSGEAPGNPNPGDLWWNEETGNLSVWLPNQGCGSWVNIDYRNAPTQTVSPSVIYPDVTTFRAQSSSLPFGSIVRIDNVAGLNVSDNVIGVQGTLNSPAWLILHRETSAPYWTADEFGYANVADFNKDAALLPFKVPVTLTDSTGLTPNNGIYTVNNLRITISGDYEVLLMKYYTNDSWELYPDSILKYIAYSALFGGSPQQGQMWWDFANADPNTRTAAIYQETSWVALNEHPQSGPPAPVLDLGVVLFYCNDFLLQPGVSYTTDDFIFSYTEDAVTGKYNFSYSPRNFQGRVQLPVVTISDSLTTTYRADISNLVFSGLTYYMSPNVYNSETPLRLWKSEALQVADTTEHLAEDNYINPLLADLNTGPGPDNWEKYFVRLPLEYGRNETVWQKVALTCRDFGYWGSSVDPEKMRCPPEDDQPAIYEELFLYDQPISDYTYVYSEPYLYSNIAFPDATNQGTFTNSGVYPTEEVQYDEFLEAYVKEYDALHDRQAIVDPVSVQKELTILEYALKQALFRNDIKSISIIATSLLYLREKVYGDWQGIYLNVNPCLPFSGYLVNDLEAKSLEYVAAPVWDASIYKFAPTCENEVSSYNVDSNHFKIGYCYFVADASAAEDAFFDITKEASWRYPIDQPRTSYLTPR